MVTLSWMQLLGALLLAIGGPRVVGALFGRGAWALWFKDAVQREVATYLQTDDYRKAESLRIAALIPAPRVDLDDIAKKVVESAHFQTALAAGVGAAVASESFREAIARAVTAKLDDAIRRDDGIIRQAMNNALADTREEVAQLSTGVGALTNQLGRIEGMLSMMQRLHEKG